MRFNAGEIYFIQEYDPQTARPTKYVKIGLVRDGRTTAQRIKEHQTGNPRALKETKLLQTPAVSFVERMLHQMFAENRITGGEWFIFTESELNSCMEAAKHLVADVKKQESIFAAAEAFKTKRSKKATIAASKQALALHKEYFKSDFLLRELKSVIEKYEKRLDEKAGEGEDIDDARSQKQVNRSLFDVKALQVAQPSVYKKYLVTTTSVSGTFRIVPNKGYNFSLNVISPKLESFISGFYGTIEQLKKNPKVLDVAKAKYSFIKGQVARAEWEREKAINQLRLLCANNAGIEGICTWVRVAKEKKEFSRTAFKAARPDLYLKYSKTQTTTRRVTKAGRTSAGKKVR